ncbi:CHY zinc finger protein [Microbacterium hydrocarbonoxydans]|uniref:CHY zinc finger protein n=1 Tax=Microbacterium hydrocarbonoxydans TaxID=273678 RepID=UPI0013D94D8D|nr:CHY zinc finger protein [Microbacterium hydrocarbonoxydans]
MSDEPRSIRPPVLGAVIDGMTRCVHYRTPVDIVAIRFACCGDYYPCHRCHEEAAGHPARQWPVAERGTRAVLCGACGAELAIVEYLGASGCPRCGAAFNERCALHAHLYFEPSA